MKQQKPSKSKEKLNQGQTDILKTYQSLAKSLGQFPSFADLDRAGITRSKIRHHFGNLGNLREQFKISKPKDYVLCEKKEEEGKVKNTLLASNAKLVFEYGRFLTLRELEENGITTRMVEYHFGSLKKFAEETEKAHSELFEDIVTESLFTPERFEETRREIQNYSKFVITTVLAGCKVDQNFLKSIKSYCEENDALLLLLPQSDPASNRSRLGQHAMFDGVLKDEHFIYDDILLNSNFHISGIRLQAKQINPVTGLSRIGQRTGSFVYGSPKQTLELVPNSKFPRVMMTPGALTLADYTTELYISNRTAYIADHDHLMGAIVVELEDDDIYHFRQLQSDSEGRFIDLGVMYDGDSKTKVSPSAFVMGDLHVEDHDPEALRCWEEVMEEMKPDYLVLHDAFNGHSINHHERKKKLTQALSHEKERNILEEEARAYASMLEYLSNKVSKEVIVVKSNHDEFIDRWLEDACYINEPQNYILGHKLVLAKAEDKKDVCEFLLETFSEGKKAKPVRFLQRDESFKVADIELGYHGDQGANGARGSLNAMEKSFKNSVSGHTHQMRIMRGAWSVGTTSYLRLNYNKGPSSWTQTSCLVYPNGMRQLVTCIEGKWRADPCQE